MKNLEEEFNMIVDALILDEEQRNKLLARKNEYIENNHLNLSSLSLTNLPEDLFKDNESILHLNISENKINAYPEGVFQPLHQLLSLDISYSMDPTTLDESEPLTLPENIFKSQLNLLLLDLSGNQLEFLPDGLFDTLFNIETLNMSYNLLALLPVSIGNCINLEELYLESNFFPIEFKDVYGDYISVQDFIAPFSAAWNVMNNPIDMINEIGLPDDAYDDNELKTSLSNQLRDVFKDKN